MSSYSDVGCVLKFNKNCDACKLKMHEVLSSIAGGYAVTIDADEGLVKISAEMDLNILMKAIYRNGMHAELKWLSLKDPNNTYDRYGPHVYGPHVYGAMEQGPYGYRDSRALPEGMFHEAHQNHYSDRRPDIWQGPYGYRDSRALPEGMFHEAHQNYYPDRRPDIWQGPYGYRDSRALPEGMFHEAHQNYYSDKRPGYWDYPDYNYSINYGNGGQYSYYDCNCYYY